MMSLYEPQRPTDPPAVLSRVREGLPLVNIICHQVRRQIGSVVRMDDIVSYGREGLLAAARSFDPMRGVPFRRWANIRVRGSVIDGIRSSSTLPRSVYSRLRAADGGTARPQECSEAEDCAERDRNAEDADRKLDEYLASAATAIAIGLSGGSSIDDLGEPTDRSPSAEERLVREELLTAIRGAIRELPDTERTLLERHYFGGVTFEKAASELGLSKSWASRLHARAIVAVTRSLKRRRVLFV
jgi:RNA polymerase sigma factor for flagellar operon FliA